MDKVEQQTNSGSGAILVGLGILLSRIVGLVRERVFAHYFGNSAAADAFKAALRIPNVLQNLFGEGVLSGSFIPVYARLRAEGRNDEAEKVAGAVLSMLVLVVALIVALGVTFAPQLVGIIAPGFADEKRALTIQLTRIFFPGIGLLVCSAWCLGVLNSHRRFFLSYSAPVLWNVIIITTLIVFGRRGHVQDALAVYAAWGVVAGCAAQFLVQLPSTINSLGRIRLGVDRTPEVRSVLSNFFPILGGRGISQISAYVDSLLASLLPTGAVAALSYAQTIYLLPIGLFAMSVSAAELPAMSRILGERGAVEEAIRKRLEHALRHVCFFVVPSCFAFWMLGDLIVAGVFQTGAFGARDTQLVWFVLSAATLGLLPATLARLYASTFYALGDSRTPLRFSLFRVVLSVGLGCAGALWLPDALGLEGYWGLIFLSAASALAAIAEFEFLRRALRKRVAGAGAIPSDLGRIVVCAAAGALLGRISSLIVDGAIAQLLAGCVGYGAVYLLLVNVLRIPEGRQLLRRMKVV